MGWFRTSKEVPTTKVTVNGKEPDKEAAWTWSQLSFNVLSRSALFVTKTILEILKQGLATSTAIPTMINGKHAGKIFQGILVIARYDLLPLIVFNMANKTLQAQSFENEYSIYGAQSFDIAVNAYNFHRAPQAFLHMQVLLSLAAIAFKKDSPFPSNKCIKDGCDIKGTTSGIIREPIIILANKGMVAAMQYLPYGHIIRPLMSVALHGRIVSRLTNIDLCERHRLPSLPQEYILALGITHFLFLKAMEYAFENTIGLPNWFTLLIIQSIFLLFHINLAAHVPVTVLPTEQRTIPYDPLDLYDAGWRMLSDGVFGGVSKIIDKYTKPEEGVPPLIPITTIFKGLTQLLESDKEVEVGSVKKVEGIRRLGFFKDQSTKVIKMALPPMTRGVKEFTNDHIIRMYWPDLTDQALAQLKFIKTIGRSKPATVVSSSPRGTTIAARLLQIFLGFPEEGIKTFLSFCKEKEFWAFNKALKEWLERHQLGGALLRLEAPKDITPLHGEARLPIPEESTLPEAEPAHQLQGYNEQTDTSSTRFSIDDLDSLPASSFQANDDDGTYEAQSLFAR
ncbi:MAG: hypothetical protein EPN84_07300 [Legionella sp.]|nr:MAG: hypothetical protein EPN84_07300 [Legionella sp.]